jgi:hypothetical protein
MARKELVNPDPEDLRKDLLAALAAGRELGPEMDRAIVDAHLRRHYGDAARPAAQPKPQVAVRRASIGPDVLRAMMILAGVATFAAVLVLTHGFGIWFVWPLLIWGWGWGRGGRRGGWGGGYRNDRWDYRGGRRWGDDPNGAGDGARDRSLTAPAPHEWV